MCAAAVAIGLLAPASASALRIHPVVADRKVLDPEGGDTLTVRFALDQPARVHLEIWDGRDIRIREVSSERELPAGEHALAWDGRDAAGRPVPGEAYRWTLRAEGEGGAVVRYDLTDATLGEEIGLQDLRWDSEAGVVRYVLQEPARVNLRVGLQGMGPLLRTLLDWAPRPAGPHAEPWDGEDASGVLELETHPRLQLAPNAFRLPENTIFVAPLPGKAAWIEPVTWEATRRESEQPRRWGFFAAQRMEERRDIAITLRLPDGLPRSEDGIAIVREAVPVEMEIPNPDDRQRLLAERFEVAFFVDGQYRFENEVGFLPATWIWDPATANPGLHYITGNLYGYDGHVGMATIRVRVPDEAEAARSER